MRSGLRTEIILSVTLVLAAALLFAGFLLVKHTERELLLQKQAHARSVMRLLAATTESHDFKDLDVVTQNLTSVIAKLPDVISWRLIDVQMQVLSDSLAQPAIAFSSISPTALEPGEMFEELNYQPYRFFEQGQTPNFLNLSMSLWPSDELKGLLQIRFDLDLLQNRIQTSQKLVLVYVGLYGVVLALFAVYLLNRTIVKPIRQLHQATTFAAGGILAPVGVPTGPGEIRELAESFNHMVGALSDSRAEKEEYIASLEASNTALAQAKDDLIRSEKLATVGHLAAGMAHEIGNPLAAVIGYLNLLHSDLSGEKQDIVNRSLHEMQRIDRLVRELLEYSAPVDQETELFCPVQTLRETIEMLRHQGQLDEIEIIDLSAIYGCQVRMDQSRLMQVWINLLLNARDAMENSGTIQILTRREQDQIRISICDEGHGISDDMQKQIFEPFYTTKDPGKGYGLGLAVCQRIVEENGGSLEVSSEAGQGASFTVSLPCITEQIS